MKKICCISILFTSLFVSFCAGETGHPTTEKTASSSRMNPVKTFMIQDKAIYTEHWDTLAQTIFWRTVMKMQPDTGVINIGSTRKIIEGFSYNNWENKTPEAKIAYRDSIKNYYCLAPDEHIYFTTGKNEFYQIERVIPNIDRAIPIFEANQTDPWFAQAILLVESPGIPKKSKVGAHGSFQLMRGVARQMGLIINRNIDERKDFEKSAKGAAKLLSTVCIPKTNKMLDKRGICYTGNELWYRLLVLHVYHAGIGNVAKAIDCMDITQEGNHVITELWKAECGNFRNASQNYSQVVLASIMELDELLNKQNQAYLYSEEFSSPQ